MRATVRDVARRAGVSAKTVSNVINGTFAVSPNTRQRVEEALAELDYVPNLAARGLRNGRTGLIALILPDVGTAYSAEMTHHLLIAAAKRGLSVQIEESGGGGEEERERLSRARPHRVDGMVLNPLLLESSVFPRGGSLAPVVLLGEVADSPVDHVRMDDRAACREMTSLLIHEGHRRIAVVGKMDTPTATLRLAGYLAALRDAGLERREALEIDTTAWTPASGAAATRRYLAQHELPDAMFCFTDALALGVLSVLWSQGARVPDDVSVAGYDDVAMSEFAVPPLTTVRFDRQLIAEAALTLLSQRIADHDRPITSITVPHRIVRRASTRSRRT